MKKNRSYNSHLCDFYATVFYCWKTGLYKEFGRIYLLWLFLLSFSFIWRIGQCRRYSWKKIITNKTCYSICKKNQVNCGKLFYTSIWFFTWHSRNQYSTRTAIIYVLVLFCVFLPFAILDERRWYHAHIFFREYYTIAIWFSNEISYQKKNILLLQGACQTF